MCELPEERLSSLREISSLRLRLATLLKVLFTLASSGDQSHTVVEAESFLSACIAVHQSQCSWKGSLQQQLHEQSEHFCHRKVTGLTA